MKRSVIRALILAAVCLASRLPTAFADRSVPSAPGIQYCPPQGETYADCTAAACPLVGDKTATCLCKAKRNMEGTITSSKEGCKGGTGRENLQSRYSPVTSFGICTNPNQLWAACLGVQCNYAQPGQTVFCTCDQITSENLQSSQFVMVAPLAQSDCSSKIIYSSATLTQMFEATALLRAYGNPSPDPSAGWVFPQTADKLGRQPMHPILGLLFRIQDLLLQRFSGMTLPLP